MSRQEIEKIYLDRIARAKERERERDMIDKQIAKIINQKFYIPFVTRRKLNSLLHKKPFNYIHFTLVGYEHASIISEELTRCIYAPVYIPFYSRWKMQELLKKKVPNNDKLD